MKQFLKLMRIFELMWLVAAAVSLYMAISRSIKGEQYGNYIYITIFTAAVAFFMYMFKKRNRRYLTGYYRKLEEEAAAAEQSKKAEEAGGTAVKP